MKANIYFGLPKQANPLPKDSKRAIWNDGGGGHIKRPKSELVRNGPMDMCTYARVSGESALPVRRRTPTHTPDFEEGGVLIGGGGRDGFEQWPGGGWGDDQK